MLPLKSTCSTWKLHNDNSISTMNCILSRWRNFDHNNSSLEKIFYLRKITTRGIQRYLYTFRMHSTRKQPQHCSPRKKSTLYLFRKYYSGSSKKILQFCIVYSRGWFGRRSTFFLQCALPLSDVMCNGCCGEELQLITTPSLLKQARWSNRIVADLLLPIVFKKAHWRIPYCLHFSTLSSITRTCRTTKLPISVVLTWQEEFKRTKLEYIFQY